MNIPFVGQAVENQTFDYSFALIISGGYEVRIESAFTLADARSEQFKIDPGEYGLSKVALEQIVGQRIYRAETSDAGDLNLIFESNAGLHLGPDPSFEAWTITGPYGLKIVCEAGGGLAVWGNAD